MFLKINPFPIAKLILETLFTGLFTSFYFLYFVWFVMVIKQLPQTINKSNEAFEEKLLTSCQC